jgi:hypothetical protein
VKQAWRSEESASVKRRLRYLGRGRILKAAINKELEDVTVGFWQDFYKGGYGRLAGGLEWEFIRRLSSREWRDRCHCCGAGCPPWIGGFGFDVGQRLHGLAGYLTLALNQQEKFI